MAGGTPPFESQYLLQCEVVRDELGRYAGMREAVAAVPDETPIELFEQSTTVGEIHARVLRMGEFAEQHLAGATQAGEDALAPYRAVLAHDKLAVFEDHPAPDFRYYTTNKKVIESPDELAAAAEYWYFEGTLDMPGTVEVDGRTAQVSVQGWRVLGWKFDAEGRTVAEFEEQGQGMSAPKSAFQHGVEPPA